MKKVLVFFLALSISLFAAACSGGGVGGLEKEYSVEFGSPFYLPKVEGDYTVSIKDPNGNDVKTQFGSFRPTVGEYTAEYDIEGKKQSVKIVCTDTTAPVVSFGLYEANVSVGDEITVPGFQASDLSAVSSTSVKVTNSSGGEVTLTDNKWTAENDVYTVTVTAVDAYGNTGTGKAVVTARQSFTDTDRAANVLYDFDEREYINLVYGAENQTNFDAEIVTGGYPAIQSEKSGNGVLKLSTDCNYGDVYIKFASYETFAARSAGKIVLRVAVDRDTDYVKVINGNGVTAGAAYMLKKNVWTEVTVDPIDFGYGSVFNNFLLCARADLGLNLFIDEIYYTDRYVPELERGELAVFDNEGYVGRMYQNIYNGQPWVGGGSTFELVDNSGTKAVRIKTTQNRGGFTYMFNERIDLAEVESITIRMNCHKSPQHIWVGTMQGTYLGGSSYSDLAGWETDWRHLYAGQMHDYVITPEQLWTRCCADGYLSGIWMSVIDAYNTEHTIDIESITVQYKN